MSSVQKTRGEKRNGKGYKTAVPKQGSGETADPAYDGIPWVMQARNLHVCRLSGSGVSVVPPLHCAMVHRGITGRSSYNFVSSCLLPREAGTGEKENAGFM